MSSRQLPQNTVALGRSSLRSPTASMTGHPIDHLFRSPPSYTSSPPPQLVAARPSPLKPYRAESPTTHASPTNLPTTRYPIHLDAERPSPFAPPSGAHYAMSTPRRPSGSSSTPGSSREERYESRRGKWLQETSVQIAERELLEEQRGKDLEARRQIEEKNQKLMNPQDLMAENEEYFMNTPKFVLYALRRYCLTKPANHFKNLFMQYDENSDGTLDIQEIKNGIGRLGFDITMKTATEVLNMMDLDGNCELDFAEFRCAILDERIAKDFEDHARRMHNDCKLQEEYRARCLKEPLCASIHGPAAIPHPSEGYKHHMDILQKQREGMVPMMSAKEKAQFELEQNRLALQEEMAAVRARDAANAGEKNTKEQEQVMGKLEAKFKNLRAAFSKMDVDNSGFLDRDEMEELCFHLNLPKAWVAPLIDDADVDGDGQISYEEFAKALEVKSHLGQGSEEYEDPDVLHWHTGPDPEYQAHIFGEVMGNTNYREGPPVPQALPLAGGWDKSTRLSRSKQPLRFSAHASHLTRTVSAVIEDGITQCCVRPLSFHVKASAPNFLK